MNKTTFGLLIAASFVVGLFLAHHAAAYARDLGDQDYAQWAAEHKKAK